MQHDFMDGKFASSSVHNHLETENCAGPRSEPRRTGVLVAYSRNQLISLKKTPLVASPPGTRGRGISMGRFSQGNQLMGKFNPTHAQCFFCMLSEADTPSWLRASAIEVIVTASFFPRAQENQEISVLN